MLRRTPAALIVLLIAGPARAERPHAALTLEYAPGPHAPRCPKEKLLHDEIGRRIGYDPFEPGSPARLTVTIERSKEAYRVTGKIRDAGKETFAEEVVGPDCAAAVTMVVRALAAELTTVPTPPPEPAPIAPPVATPPAPPVLPAPVRERARLRVAAGAAVAFNLSPAVLSGPVVAAGVRYSFISVALEGRMLFGPTAAVGGIRVLPSFYSGAVSGCGYYRALFGCGRVEIGRLRFQPPDGVMSPPHDFFFAGAGLQLGAEWFFAEHVAVNGYADVRIATRAPIELRSSTENRVAWSSSQPSPGLGLGLIVSY
jgi:hypothetical protein